MIGAIMTGDKHTPDDRQIALAFFYLLFLVYWKEEERLLRKE